MGTELDRLTSTMTGSAAPGAIAAAAAPVLQLPTAFWVVLAGITTSITPDELRTHVANGYDGPVAGPDGNWLKAANWGITKPAPAPVAPPAPPASVAPAAPVPPPAPAMPTLGAAALAGTVATASPTSVGPAVHATAEREMSVLVRDEAAAMSVMALLTAPNMSIHDVIDAADGGDGMSYILPFARVDAKGWQVPKQLRERNDGTLEHLPAGDRPWTGIYIATRMGALGWKGAGQQGKKGDPPLYRFALPSHRVEPSTVVLAAEIMKIASRIQYTKADLRSKFDELGRLSPVLDTLVWRPQLGFCLLVSSGFRSVQLTNASSRKWEEDQLVMKPICFDIMKEEIVNKKKLEANPQAKDATWVEAGIMGAADASQRGQIIYNEFQAEFNRDRVGFMNVVSNFLHGKDFQGLSLPEIAALLPKYAPLIVEKNEAAAGA